ncbi:MAG TPA: hypothetical protein VKY31_09720 [Terriglobia bacterium]|nr:hypothetical protein [Terriglobia bacterium]
MAKTKLNVIKPSLGVLGLTDADLLQRLNAVHDGMTNNPAYPNPPVDMPGFKTAIDTFSAAVSTAADGSKTAMRTRNQRRADVIVLYRLLGHYVEGACKNDMNTFASSGFQPAPKGPRTPPQPVGVPTINRIEQGQAGELLAYIDLVPKANHYEVRYAPVQAAGAAIVNWTTVVVASTKPPASLTPLTPGVNYTIQARAFGKLGFSSWSSSVERMVI